MDPFEKFWLKNRNISIFQKMYFDIQPDHSVSGPEGPLKEHILTCLMEINKHLPTLTVSFPFYCGFD